MKNTLLNQLCKLLNLKDFSRISQDDKKVCSARTFSAKQHFLVLLFSQIKALSSLRETVEVLHCHSKQWAHLGLKSVPRSTLSDANRNRDAESFQKFFYHLLGRFRGHFPSHKFHFKSKFYSIDSSTISLSLSLFPWAKYRSKKGGIKLHTMIDNGGYIPTFVAITEAKVNDIYLTKILPTIEKGAIIAFDKGYIDFKWFQTLTEEGIFFVTRAKRNISYRILKRNTIDRDKGITADYTIELKGKKEKQKYSGKLRLIKFIHPQTGEEYTYLTNIFHLVAPTIADCYKERWQIELFFKWIKQNLKIKAFHGTTESAVMMQIYTALIYYLLLAFIKFSNEIQWSMLTLTRVIRERMFEKIKLLEVLKPPKIAGSSSVTRGKI